MSDLIERLREGLTVLDEPYHYSSIARTMSEAADALEAANKRIAELESDYGEMCREHEAQLRKLSNGIDIEWIEQ